MLENIESYPYNHFQYHYLNRYYHLTMAMRNHAIKFSLERCISTYDKAPIALFRVAPTEGMADKLFFFFHGMDGDCADVIIARDLVIRGKAEMIGVGGRGPSWVSDAFFKDSEQVIRKYSDGWSSFYLSGVSMGATQALSLAAIMPEDLKVKIKGIIALIPGTNLPIILEHTSRERVRETLNDSVGGDLLKLAARSPHNLVDRLEAILPFVIFYNKNDSILIAEETEKYIKTLAVRNPVSVFANNLDHDFTHRNVDFVRIFEELGVKSLALKPLPHRE